ncbi:MAG: hypothetical protein ACI9BW_002635 [Gammaproteobacteria bacterium]|jgi:hypothetical protein
MRGLQMEWEVIATIAEVVGAVAVIVTLLYLSTQIRQTNKAIRSSSFHEITNSWNEINGWMATDESLARILRIGLAKPEDLTEDEFARMSFVLLAAFHVMETIYFQREAGTVDSRLWEAEKRSMKTFLNSPGGRMWWKENPYSFTTDYRIFVDKEIIGIENGPE